MLFDLVTGLIRVLQGKRFLTRRQRQMRWEKKRKWEYIGGSGYGGGNLKRVPTWVQKEISKIWARGQAHPEQYFILKGRSYYYRVSFSGQGATNTSIERSIRRKPKGKGK